MISSLSSGESGTISCSFWDIDSWNSEAKGVVAENGETSTLKEELSTRMMFFSEGTLALSTLFALRSGIICCKSETFSLGGLYARFVSAPMIRCAASRCDRAAITCGELNAGFSGTCLCQPMHSISIPTAELTRIAPSLNKAYVTTANSQLFPRLTATRSPFWTPLALKPSARALLLSSSSL